MTYADWLKIVASILVPMAAGFVYIGRKLEGQQTLRRDVDEIREEKLPGRVRVLESLAGVK